jgi:hypothetical protein
MLNTFVIVEKGSIISPQLLTTREYGRWLSATFDEYTVAQELFLRTKKGNESLLESHPGTRIGSYFDSNKFSKYELQCWYVESDSDIMKKLIKYGIAELGDCSRHNQKQMLRLYTVDQIQLYIQTKIDRHFDFGNDILTPKQIITQQMDKVEMPVKQKTKKLF